ncbi:MAG TPA: hypothetical protein PKO15_11425 [Fibrobacteria bacterium]|nr:hypothetical protein [Fibrobacteria bacterium]HOX50991.1 hypothetical protein [Fibrobacteria bacterium]
MAFNPLSFLGKKLVRPVLRKLAGDTGEQFRRENELRRKVAIAAVAVARSRSLSDPSVSVQADAGSSVTAWQAVMRGRTIKGRSVR